MTGSMQACACVLPRVCACSCVCARACVRVYVCACVHACMRARVRACVRMGRPPVQTDATLSMLYSCGPYSYGPMQLWPYIVITYIVITYTGMACIGCDSLHALCLAPAQSLLLESACNKLSISTGSVILRDACTSLHRACTLHHSVRTRVPHIGHNCVP